MPKLSERIDMKSVKAVLLPMPKGKKSGSGLGFCAGEPAGCISGAGYSSPPQIWQDGKAVPLTFQELKKLALSGARGNQAVGSWMDTKGRPHALLWNRQSDGKMSGVELHPAKWEK